MVVLGGMGYVPGVILGAITLATLPELLRYVVVPVQQIWFGEVLLAPEILKQLLVGLAMVVIMLTRPAGMWASPKSENRPVKGVQPAT